MRERVGGSMVAVFVCGSIPEGQLLVWNISSLFEFVSRSSSVLRCGGIVQIYLQDRLDVRFGYASISCSIFVRQ